jgi:hypothetical protein
MNNHEEYTEDHLRQYINPEMIEKAPEGFTSGVMSRIHIKESPVPTAGKLGNRSLIPVISVAVTVLLLMSALLIPGKNDTISLPSIELIKNLKVVLPEIDLVSFFKFNLSQTLIYGLTGILILTLFDRALYGLFHRNN